MENDKEDLKEYSGEEHYRRTPRLVLPIVKLQGNQGIFNLSSPIEDKWETTEIGTSLKLIILRVRRALGYISDDERLFSTEHNSPQDVITLYSAVGKNIQPLMNGTSTQIREKYQKVRTQQILYCMTEAKELIKLTVKGASLGSKNKLEDSIPLYDYYEEFAPEEHLYEFWTLITAKPEKGKLGTYYAMSFEKGEKHNLMEEVANQLKYLYGVLKTVAVKEIAPIQPTTKELPIIDIDEDDIKAEDLPF